VESFIRWDTVVDLLLGIGLSAATGFRVFVPFLVLSAAAVLGHVDLPASFDWIETNQALIVLAVASLLEVTGYYIPWLDHMLDIVATPAAIFAGTLVTAAATSGMNPLLHWTLAIIAGGGTAGLTKGMGNLVRILSSSVSAGLSNPLVATIELAFAVLLTALAIVLPAATGILVIASLLITFQKIRRFLAKTPAQINPSEVETRPNNPEPIVPQS
jgi:hypothetical protein